MGRFFPFLYDVDGKESSSLRPQTVASGARNFHLATQNYRQSSEIIVWLSLSTQNACATTAFPKQFEH